VGSVYTGVNILLGKTAWDPYPFILLKSLSFVTGRDPGAVIMMSQNRQDTKIACAVNSISIVNRRAAYDIQGLARKLNLLGER